MAFAALQGIVYHRCVHNPLEVYNNIEVLYTPLSIT